MPLSLVQSMSSPEPPLPPEPVVIAPLPPVDVLPALPPVALPPVALPALPPVDVLPAAPPPPVDVLVAPAPPVSSPPPADDDPPFPQAEAVSKSERTNKHFVFMGYLAGRAYPNTTASELRSDVLRAPRRLR